MATVVRATFPDFMGKSLGRNKAREILRHGKVRGKRLSKRQKRFFGLIAGGGRPTRMHKASGSPFKIGIGGHIRYG